MGTIADKLEYLNDTKQEIKEAIVNKGQSIADTDTFRSYADKISKIVVSKTQSKSQEITSNTTTTIKPDSGYTGLSQVTVTTKVPDLGASTGFVAFQHTQQYGEGGTMSKTFTFPAGVKYAILAIQVHQNSAGNPDDAIITGNGISASKITKTNSINGGYNGQWNIWITDYVYKLTHSSTTSAVTVTVSVTASQPRGLFGTLAY